MLLILGALIVAIALTIIHRSRAHGGVDASGLGWMSERWLNEQRASNPT